ncbi:MAG: GerAB/ArcD/ProY family transporter [Clostridia bacterium]|nr:GerAB/ArcD/ProY family transporter [Clostridia bacterium]
MKNKISPVQAYSLLFISRIVSTLTFVPPDLDAVGSDYVAAALIAPPLVLAASIMWLHLMSDGRTLIIRKVFFRNPKAEKSVRFIAVLYLLLVFTRNLSGLCVFAMSVLFEKVNAVVLLTVTAAAVIFVALSGIEAIARLGFFGSVATLLSLAFIVFSLTGRFDANNLQPLFLNGASKPVLLSLTVLSGTIEPFLLFLMRREVNDKIKKGFVWWWAAVFSVQILLTLCLYLGLGNVALRMFFPYHAMAELSRLSIARRMDSLLSTVWVLASFIKCALCLHLADNELKKISLGSSRVLTSVFTAVAFLISLLALNNIGVYRFVNNPNINAALNLPVILIVPIILNAVVKINLKREK